MLGVGVMWDISMLTDARNVMKVCVCSLCLCIHLVVIYRTHFYWLPLLVVFPAAAVVVELLPMMGMYWFRLSFYL